MDAPTPNSALPLNGHGSAVADGETRRKKKKKASSSSSNGVAGKERKRRPKSSSSRSSRRSSAASSSSGPLSAAAVCASLGGAVPPGGKAGAAAADLTRSMTNVGLTFALLVPVLYLFGCVASIRSLPAVNPRMRPVWAPRRFARAQFGGGNLNVARDGLVPSEDVGGGGDGETEHEGADGGRAAANLRGGAAPDADDAAGKAAAAAPKPQAVGVPGDRPLVPRVSPHRWPVSVRDEDGNFEDIKHPGDASMTMTVPKFWSDPIHDDKRMTRQQAMSIGSCITPDPKTGSHARGDACPPSERTVFVAIASYRDWQCRYTVESIFTRAKHPERIRVGVVDQIVDGEDFSCEVSIKPCKEDPNQALCKYKDSIDVYQMDAIMAVGPVFARHVGHRLYRGEYYAMQSDAHITFVQDWDEDIIMQQESTKDEMAVQTTYLTDVVGSVDERTGKSLRRTRPIMCNTDYEGGQQGKHLRHLSQPERVPSIKGTPQLEPYWAAGFSFSRGHFVVNVPYDQYQPMIFQGEEMSIGLRGFTIGYDFFATERSVCFHHYANGINKEARGKVKTFWEHAPKYKGTGIRAMKRLLGIVKMNPEVDPKEWDHTEEKRYGLGGVRTPQKFYETFGIDVVNKKTEHHLCKFVQPGTMHNQFMKYLRSDGMGIDYEKIQYRFKDPGFDNT